MAIALSESELLPTDIVIRPQDGPQKRFMETEADIVVYGGSAGGGKSWALLLDALYYAALEPVFGFGAVIFRRTSPQITQEGGLWDEAGKLYPYAGGTPKQTRLEYVWTEHRTKVRFAHMQYEGDRFNWQGSQIAYIGFDELTHFTEEQFFYMLSRNRSLCGVKPRVRATTNPDADSWVKRFLAPWVDEEWPQEDRAISGEVRWFIRDGGQIVWLKSGETHPEAKSVTFIRADIYDNKILLETNPEYLINLKSLPLIDRERLLNGNWSIRPEGGQYFKKHWFPVLDIRPEDIEAECRYWDKAATEIVPSSSKKQDPDYTASVLMGRRKPGAYPRYVVLDATWDRKSPGGVEKLIRQVAEHDDECYTDGRGMLVHGKYVRVCIEEEAGSSGKDDTYTFVTKVLDGFDAHGKRATGSKEVRAKAPSAQAEQGNIALLKGSWNAAFLDFLEAFPNPKVHDDPVDGLSGAYGEVCTPRLPSWAEEDEVAPREEVPIVDAIKQAQVDPFAYVDSLGMWGDE